MKSDQPSRNAVIITIAILSTLAICPLAHAQSNQEMNQSAAASYESADKAMNSAYQQLLKILNDDGKKRLRETQRAWVTYRDAQAAFDSHHFAGGSAETLETLGSLKLLTQQRTQRLKEDYQRFLEMSR